MVQVAYPLDKVLFLLTVCVVIQNFFYFKFWVIIDGDGRWWGLWCFAIGDTCRISVLSQEGDMEDRVDLEGVWQCQFECHWGDLLGNAIGACEAVL
jgi:hypothetical protein